MNATEQFHDLAIKALSGQCTDADRSALETLLGENPAWRSDYAAMRTLWDLMDKMARSPGPLPGAPSQIPPTPMRRLQREARDVFARKQRGMPSSTPSSMDDDWPLPEPLPRKAWEAADMARKAPPDLASATPDPISWAAMRHRASFDTESSLAVALRRRIEERERSRRERSLEQLRQRLHQRLREAQDRLRECEETTRACRMELDAILQELESLAPHQPQPKPEPQP